jgi:N-acylneuraminate cytidylyltransferase
MIPDRQEREDVCEQALAMALIPARGGSKGIPRKNLQLIGGVPLIGRSILAAHTSQRVDRVVVTTDDVEIAEVAKSFGAHVVQRPAKLADDVASSEAALLHCLDVLELEIPLPERFVFLQCTSPFTTGVQIDAVLSALDDPTIQSALAVTPWHGFLWRTGGEGVNHDSSRPRQRRQDLEPQYLETGAIYALRTNKFRQEKNRFCQPIRPVVIDAHSPEIDEPADLEWCNFLDQRRHGNAPRQLD